MSVSYFNHVKIVGMKTVIPEHFIDIDDELQYFDNNPKKLARQKKMIGYGRRYIADERTTAVDLACYAAQSLMEEMNTSREDIDLLLFVNQKPDYIEPCDACIAHGKLGLPQTTAAQQINLGCSGYVYALWTAHCMIECGAARKCLLLAGDVQGMAVDQTNRKSAPVFGDAVSATIIEHSENEVKASFVLGTDGSGWNKIVMPFGGARLPFKNDVVDLQWTDESGNKWNSHEGIMKGEDVFSFTMNVAPRLIQDTMSASGLTCENVDLFAIHQANRQILDMIIAKAGIPQCKSPTDVFTKYANNSTNSVVTVVCDQPKERKIDRTIMATFGIGLSWGGASLDLSGMYNGGVSTYHTPADAPSREQQIEYWRKHFNGEV